MSRVPLSGGGGGSPSGAAGGDLAGTYPNPTVAQMTGSVQVGSGVTTLASVLNTSSVQQVWASYWHVGAGDDRFQLGLGAGGAGSADIVSQPVSNQLYLQATSSIALSNKSGTPSVVISTNAPTGASTMLWVATVTSALIGLSDNATNSATGATITLRGQNATGTTAIGGDAVLQSGTGTSRYGEAKIVGPANVGRFVQAMADANQTVSAANSVANIIEVTGALTAQRALTLTRPPSSGAMVIVNNKCTGGFGITIAFSSGTAFTIASGKCAIVYGDGTNAQGFTITT